MIRLAIPLLISAAVLSGCGTGEASIVADESLDDATPVPVEVALPARQDIFATYEATASIASDADAPVLARAEGEVVKLLVEEGDVVQKGQVLARLDGERLRLEMLAAKANLERARKEYQRNVDLHERGLISKSHFEGLKFDLDALQASYDLARLNYGYSAIRATIAGVVSSREIKSGEHLKVGQVAFRITDTAELLAYLQIPQAELPKIKAGDAATLQVAAMPDTYFDARIARISPTIDARNGTFRATVIIDNQKAMLAPGMFGRFAIAWEKHENALTIPAHALLDEDEQTTVYVVDNGAVDRRIVETGVISGGRVEILSGIGERDQIVVVGHGGLRDGAKVLASTVDTSRLTG